MLASQYKSSIQASKGLKLELIICFLFYTYLSVTHRYMPCLCNELRLVIFEQFSEQCFFKPRLICVYTLSFSTLRQEWKFTMIYADMYINLLLVMPKIVCCRR